MHNYFTTSHLTLYTSFFSNFQVHTFTLHISHFIKFVMLFITWPWTFVTEGTNEKVIDLNLTIKLIYYIKYKQIKYSN